MSWHNRRNAKTRGARRRLDAWAADPVHPLDRYLEDLGWDWWAVAARPWSSMPPPRPTVKALRFAVATFDAHRASWAETGARWHAAHPETSPPLVTLWVTPRDLYRCELRLAVGGRADALRTELASPDGPQRAVPSWLAAAAPGLHWQASWVYEAWAEDELSDMTPVQRRRLHRFGPLVASQHSPTYRIARAGVAWTGLVPDDALSLGRA